MIELLSVALITFGALFILVPVFLFLVRVVGIYTIVQERTCHVYVLFGKVIGTIDDPGLHILPFRLGLSAFLVNWLGQRHIIDMRVDQEYLRSQPVNSEEGAPIGIVETTLGGQYISVNDAFCRIVGYEKEEVLGLNITDLTHADDRAQVLGDMLERGISEFVTVCGVEPGETTDVDHDQRQHGLPFVGDHHVLAQEREEVLAGVQASQRILQHRRP